MDVRPIAKSAKNFRYMVQSCLPIYMYFKTDVSALIIIILKKIRKKASMSPSRILHNWYKMAVMMVTRRNLSEDLCESNCN